MFDWCVCGVEVFGYCCCAVNDALVCVRCDDVVAILSQL